MVAEGLVHEEGYLCADLWTLWEKSVETPVGLSLKMIMSVGPTAVGVVFVVGGLSLGEEAQVGASLVVGRRLVREVVGGG